MSKNKFSFLQKMLRHEALLVICIVGITLLTRVIHLTSIPIFTDEAIYIRWAQIGLADPAHRFISLTDGKQPLLIWLMYPMLSIFSDPLVAGRFVSVLSGVGSVIGVYLLTRELFGRKAAIFSSLLYIISPFTFLYDRMALMDSALSMFGIWSLYLEVLLVRRLRLDVALLLGMVIGLGLLTKSTALFYIYLLPFALLLFDWKRKERIRRLLTFIGLSGIAAFIAQVMYNMLRLSPWFYIIEQKNHSFILTFGEFFASPFRLFIPNLDGLSQMLFGYLSVPMAIAIAITLVHAILKRNLAVLYVFLWFIFPFLTLASFGKVIFPRYILPMIVPLFAIAGYGFVEFLNHPRLNRRLVTGALILVMALPFYQTALLMASPIHASLPTSDRNQYFDEWPSGYGVKEVIRYLGERAEKEKIVVGTEGTFGLNPAVIEIYLGTNKNVEIHGFWPVSEVPNMLREKAKIHPTFLIFKEREDIPKDWPLRHIASYRRGTGDTHLHFYQVVPTE